MENCTRHMSLSACVLLLLSHIATIGCASSINNVAVQWNVLFSRLFCSNSGLKVEPNIILAQLNLAQWHALLALNDTGSCTTQEAVVAYASHKILANYFPFFLDILIDPLLLSQLNNLQLSTSQEKLGKRLGETVATALLQKQLVARDFSLQAVKMALNADANHLVPGIYRYLNNTPAGRDAAIFIFHNAALTRPYVVPDPIDFIATYLSNLTPPIVPSQQWDREYNLVKDIGRRDYIGRTQDMNYTAAFHGCEIVGTTTCSTETRWLAALMVTLPNGTSLYDTVTLLAKISVTLHDVLIVLTNLQFGFWFWRPEMAFKAGDTQHPPIPNWTPYLMTPPHAEYPSGTVTSEAAAATVLETFFGGDNAGPYSIYGGGAFAPTCTLSGPIVARNYTSFLAQVLDAQQARMYAGAHYNVSVTDAFTVGMVVANYIEKHWAQITPSGVLPDTSILNDFAQLPVVVGQFSPIKFVL